MSQRSHIVGPQLAANNRTLDLGAQIRDFAKVVGRRIDFVHRNLSMMLFTAIIYDTPVDTGMARGSWWTSKDAPVMGGATREDPTGAEVIREMESIVMTANVTDVLWMMNNVPYIVELEYGWSGKSPEGMVRINVARINSYVKEVVAQARNVK